MSSCAKLTTVTLLALVQLGAVDKNRLQAQEDSPQAAPKLISVVEILNEAAQVDADSVPLRDVLNQLSTRHALPIRIDGLTLSAESLSKMPDQRVVLTAQDVTLKEVLEILLEPLALDYVIEHDGIQVTSAGKAKQIHGGQHEKRIVNRSHAGESIALIGEVDLDGDGKSDLPMFFELLKAAGIKLADIVDGAGKRAAEKLGEETKFLVLGGIPDARLKRNRTEREQAEKVMEQLRELRKEARLSGVRMISLNDFLDYIGQPKANLNPDWEKPRPIDVRQLKPAEARIESALSEATEISFVDTSLRDALDFIEKLHNITVLINEPEIVADGGSVDQTVNVELSGGTLASALNRILQPMELDYVLKDEVLMITTGNKAEEWQDLRVYPRRWLVAAWEEDSRTEAAEEKLLKSIRDAVGGEWETLPTAAPPPAPGTNPVVQKRGGTMSLTPAGLVVRHNQRTHREIVGLLNQLHRAAE